MGPDNPTPGSRAERRTSARARVSRAESARAKPQEDPMGKLPAGLPAELAWVPTMVSSTYFTPCPNHTAGSGKGELTNLFCLETGETLCASCAGGREVVQIRRSSYHNVVRVRDVCRMMDVSGIQTYVINSARVVFLSERPHPRGKGGSASGRGAARARACRHCHRTLQADASDFCSISCKVSSGANMAPSEEAAAAAVEEHFPARPSAASTSATKGAKGAKVAKEEPAEKRRTGARGADKSSRGSPRTPSDASRLRTTLASDASPSPETEGGEGGTGGEETPTPSRRGAKRAPPSGVKREPATPATARRAGSGSSAKRAKTSADGDGDGNGNNTGGDGSFAVVTPPTFAPKLVLVSNSRRKNRPKRSPDA